MVNPNFSSQVKPGTSGVANASSGSNLYGWNPNSLNSLNASYGVGGTNPFVNTAQYLQGGALGGIAQAGNYSNGLESQREGLMNQIIGQLSQGGISAAASKSRNQIMQNATQGGVQASQALKGMGYGDGVSGGALAGSIQQGTTQANASDQHYSDPSYIASILGQGANAINQGMQNPLLQQSAGLEPYITGQNQTNYAQQGMGLLGTLAPIIGSYLGGMSGRPQQQQQQPAQQYNGYSGVIPTNYG